ncbi:MAG: ABC transporter permease [Stackebrandtia sp.]
MVDDNHSKDAARDTSAPTGAPTATIEADEPADVQDKEFVGLSPMRLAMRRLRRDRVGMTSLYVMVTLITLGYLSPLLAKLYGYDSQVQAPEELDGRGIPLGVLGGVSGEHWLGVTPRLGRDVLMQLLYGVRTSVSIAIVAAIVTVAVGAIMGITAGYLRGKIDAVISWLIDFFLSFPFLIFALAAVPLFTNLILGGPGRRPLWLSASMLILVFLVFGWMGTARLVRGQVLSLREREFIEAARACGAGTGHIVFKQLLPNVWAQILVTFSLLVPGFIVAAAALAFLGIGVGEPHPDLGRLGFEAVRGMRAPGGWFLLFLTGSTLFTLVLSINLFGDSLRDALNPKSNR